MNPTALQTAVLVRICSHFKFSRFPRHSRSLPMFFFYFHQTCKVNLFVQFFWLAKTWISNLLVENPILFLQCWRLLKICAMFDDGTRGFDLAVAILQKGDQVRVMFNVWQSATNQNDLGTLSKKKTITFGNFPNMGGGSSQIPKLL